MFYNSDKFYKIITDNDKKSLIELIDGFENVNDRILNLNLMIQSLCKKGKLDFVKFILSFDKYKNIFTQSTFSFEYACLSGNIELVKYLLQLDVLNINTLSENIDGSFHRACESGNIELVKFLLELFTCIDISYSDEIAFQDACRSGNIEMVKYLLEIKPDIDIFAYKNEAIKNACYSGSIEITKYLIELKQKYYREHKQGINITDLKQLLICATQSRNLELFKFLLYNNFNNFNNFNNIDLLFNNETLLVTACNSRNNALVKYLLKIKPDIDIHTTNSIKGRDYCFKFVCAKKNMELVELFYRKNPYLIYKYSELFIFLEEILDIKTRLIQNWWKKILYNPHKKIGKEFAEKQIEWAF